MEIVWDYFCRGASGFALSLLSELCYQKFQQVSFLLVSLVKKVSRVVFLLGCGILCIASKERASDPEQLRRNAPNVTPSAAAFVSLYVRTHIAWQRDRRTDRQADTDGRTEKVDRRTDRRGGQTDRLTD